MQQPKAQQPEWSDLHRVLLAGDADDLPALRRILRELPVDAYGIVFIEVAAPIQISPIVAPRRIAVRWLVRTEAASDLPGATAPARGELLTRAVSGWVCEWMPAEPRGHERDAWTLWIGRAAGARVEELRRRLRRTLDTPGSTSAHRA